MSGFLKSLKTILRPPDETKIKKYILENNLDLMKHADLAPTGLENKTH